VRGFVADPGLDPVGAGIQAVWQAIATGFSMTSGIGDIDRLLSRGGIDSILLTLWLIVGAVTFGTLLEEFGLISRLIDPMIRGRLLAHEARRARAVRPALRRGV
jgi:NhaC family Na+:H+ antiporter